VLISALLCRRKPNLLEQQAASSKQQAASSKQQALMGSYRLLYFIFIFIFISVFIYIFIAFHTGLL
jgi:cell division protein FtsL